MPRRTKIVATLGPASSDHDSLTRILAAGVDVVRLNFSHGTADDHRQRVETVRECAADLGRTVAIMADLQSPKIRVAPSSKVTVRLLTPPPPPPSERSSTLSLRGPTSRMSTSSGKV